MRRRAAYEPPFFIHGLSSEQNSQRVSKETGSKSRPYFAPMTRSDKACASRKAQRFQMRTLER